jgi:cell division protein FtsW
MLDADSTRTIMMQMILQQQKHLKGKPFLDWMFFACVIILTLLGLLMAYSTTFFWSYSEFSSPFAIFSRQLLWAVIGMAAFFVMSRIDYIFWQRIVFVVLVVCLLALVFTLVFGSDRYNARRTVFEGSIQLSEGVRLGVIIYLAAWLATRRDQVTTFVNGLAPFTIIIFLFSFLIAAQPDLSTAAGLFIIGAVMFYLAGASTKHIIVIGIAALAAFALALWLLPYAQTRFKEFFVTWRDPSQGSYHIRQSIITLGVGGMFGNGIGASYQKFGYLPTPFTDSVFAVLGEEMGWIGLLCTLALFALFAWRGLKIAERADTPFGGFLVIGVVTWIISHMLLNLLATLALIPFTGMAAPFLSLGGSSLVSILAACGLVVSVSRGTKMRVEEAREIVSNPTRKIIRAHKVSGGIHATTSVRRRNGRSRPARARRAPSDATDDFERDIRFNARLKHGARSRGIVRWRR